MGRVTSCLSNYCMLSLTHTCVHVFDDPFQAHDYVAQAGTRAQQLQACFGKGESQFQRCFVSASRAAMDQYQGTLQICTMCKSKQCLSRILKVQAIQFESPVVEVRTSAGPGFSLRYFSKSGSRIFVKPQDLSHEPPRACKDGRWRDDTGHAAKASIAV